LWIAFWLILTFGISWWNAYVAGKTWVESRVIGGFIRVVTWSAAIQSACGFTMVLAFALGGLGYALGLVGMPVLHLLANMTYLLIILPILGSGLVITIHSWIIAYRERSILGMGVASYNTFAQAYNTYEAIDGIGNAFGVVWNAVSKDDEDTNPILGIAVVLLCAAAAGGIMLTMGIIKHYAGTMPIPARVQTA
jgi:hypothetical protein